MAAAPLWETNNDDPPGTGPFGLPVVKCGE